MRQKSTLLITISMVLSSISTSGFAYNDDYISANGLKIELGQSQRYLENKLGIPQRKNANFVIWNLKNGNSLSASFDEYGLSDASISGSKPDFLYAHGFKIVLGQDTLRSVQNKHKYGCYHQGWGEGWIGEYVVRSGPEGSWNLVFSTWGDDDENTLKNKKLTTISIGDDEPFGEQKYCTY
ncbi:MULTISPECIES: hypothetical protein [Acinetobacter]|uniref:hypothetical protein n=1 Tax=Acinetobacter TaxID=469 RepID=UPI001D0EE368|nr:MULTISPECIES: hypothetical protein [Acinetobacter]